MKKVIRIARLLVAFVLVVLVGVYAAIRMWILAAFETIEAIARIFNNFNDECEEIMRNV